VTSGQSARGAGDIRQEAPEMGSDDLASSFQLSPHPQTLMLQRGRLVLVTDTDGVVRPGRGHGLFAAQTHLLDGFDWQLDGRSPLLSAIAPVGNDGSLGYYLRLPTGGGTGDPVVQAAQAAVVLRLARRVCDGWHEDVEVTNHTQQPVALSLVLRLQPADEWRELPDARSEGPHWQVEAGGEGSWSYRYEAHHDGRRIVDGLDLHVRHADSPTAGHADALQWQVRLAPGEVWTACLDLLPVISGRRLASALPPCTRDRPLGTPPVAACPVTGFATAESGTLAPVVMRAVNQAMADLQALRLSIAPELEPWFNPPADGEDGGWTVAAGVPTYLSLFGRDVLASAWQAALATPDLLRGALPRIARWQGRRRDDWRDEGPGRMLHEAQTAPAARLGLNPRGRYYGSITTSGFFPVTLSDLWHWTGDRNLVEALTGPAIRALKWLDRETRAADGFYYYRTRSPLGQRHQAWKDSDDAIVDAAGQQVDPPIATCEEQGFIYLAKLHLAEVLWRLGDHDSARTLYRDASELKRRFNETFWLEDEGYVALALDARGRPVRSIGSNPGHCLATAIIDADRVRRVADRLMAPDLFSGWGVRTLSAAHPAYNPFSYQRGSVWPVEQATFAIAFMRYGLHDHLERLSRGFFEAAALFQHGRLPELYGGQPRDAAHPFPGLYPQANAPQAWSASAVFCVVQALLGLYPYAPSRLLLLDPHLPAWLPTLTLRDLRVGDAVVSLAFQRQSDGRTGFRVLSRQGRLHLVHQPSPWSQTASLAERLQDLMAS
jgi:glycogen debranching enzyme